MSSHTAHHHPGTCRLAKDEKRARLRFPEAVAGGRAWRVWRVWRAAALAGCGLVLWLQASGPAQAADSLRGAELYRSHCASCHGASGRPVMPGAPDLSRPTALLKPDLQLLTTLRNGRGAMPGYAGQLRDRELLDLISHLRTLR